MYDVYSHLVYAIKGRERERRRSWKRAREVQKRILESLK